MKSILIIYEMPSAFIDKILKLDKETYKKIWWEGKTKIKVYSEAVPRIGETVILSNKTGYRQPFLVKKIIHEYNKGFLGWNNFLHVKIQLEETTI